MTPTFDKVHNRFKFNGHHFSHSELKEVAYSLIKEGELYEKKIGNFLIHWLDANDFIYVNTSGSTGHPKQIRLKKQSMVNSALATGDYFGLQPGDSALHCLPSHFIAGKMMLVRAMILGLEVDTVEPSLQLTFDHDNSYDFCAVVPAQLSSIIEHSRKFKTIIVGGAKIHPELKKKIASAPSQFFETFGMTETVTHVAVKQLKSSIREGSDFFKAMSNVSFKTDDRNCLIISAKRLLKEPLITNDIVDLKSETEFKWIGRYDHVVNSGGIKLFPEQIEEKLEPIMPGRFIVASEPHTELGEQLILIVEHSSDSIASIQSKIKQLKSLDDYETPKKIYALDAFKFTKNGKLQRKKTILEALS
ncbi:AMP-binding protein [Winogradskyella sp. A3E31]|uniref:AMP-binding protein n=1 Tax=Winogradskyella sp. A3E31 TaxID=3349637 RepID=UPI00398AD9BB